ncbi:hypothetical protein M446_1943 [Methylobacterium sp. 4-46]|nr:hypothetical protein M446_1943 [Methylobacterium sp. 4-46]
MSEQARLRWISVVFALLWTAAMLWWSAPLEAAAVVIWIIAGAVVGFLWHWLMSRWQRWYLGSGRGS